MTVVALSLAACGPMRDANVTSDASGSDAGTSTTAAWTTVATTTTTTTGTATDDDASATSGGSTSSSTAGTGETESTGGVPPSVCDPQPQLHGFDLTIDGQGMPWWGSTLSHTDACVVDSVASEPGTLQLALSCAAGARPAHEHELALSAADLPTVPLAPGETVGFDLWIVGDWCYAGCASVAVRDDSGDLVLAATVADRPSPEDGGWWNEPTPAAWFSPIELAVVDDVCEPEPSEEDMGGNFIQRPICFLEQRVALDLTHEGLTTRVYDGSVADIGDSAHFRVIVERARLYLDTGGCSDIGSAGYELAIARAP